MKTPVPFLWFDTQAEDAMNFYVSVFPDSKITSMSKMPDGKMFTGSFNIKGQEFMVLNAGPMFKFNESISFFVSCEDQAEVDLYWDKLVADGGEESQCGWLKDKFGLSWQIIPKQLNECLGNPDPAKAQKAMAAMMQMKKIIVADLEKAVE